MQPSNPALVALGRRGRHLIVIVVLVAIAGAVVTRLWADEPARTGASNAPATVPAAAQLDSTTAENTDSRAALAAARRAVRRQPLSDEQAKAEAAELRKLYAQPSEQWPKPHVDPGVKFVELGRLSKPEYPANNPFSKDKVELGKQLFFDARLSGSGQIACASCHDPDLAWADGRTTSFGNVRTKLRRNAPSILFSAYATSLFWDGRSGSLEDQFRAPVLAHDEMNAKPDAVAKRLNELPEYKESFKKVFGADEVTLADAAKAVATFERSIAPTTGRSDFDKFLAGDGAALSDSAVRGLHLFRTDARCINCHNGPAFTDNQFHDLGLSYYGRELEDLGRYDATNEAKDVGKFRTPSLRNVGRTRPYMHNGIFELDAVIRMYNAGMATLVRKPDQKDDPLFPTKDPLLQPLHLNDQDQADLKAFLESLNEPQSRMRPPKLPPEPAVRTG